MANSSPPDNGRVTMAEVKKDLSYIIARLDSMDQTTRTYRANQEARITELEDKCLGMSSNYARLDERQKATTGALGILVAIGSVIAAAVGAFVK